MSTVRRLAPASLTAATRRSAAPARFALWRVAVRGMFVWVRRSVGVRAPRRGICLVGPWRGEGMRMLRLHIWRAGFREKRKRTQLLRGQMMKLLAAKLGFEIGTKISGNNGASNLVLTRWK